MNLILTIQSGPQMGQTFTLVSGLQTIGRAGNNQIVITDPAISKQHARITVQSGRVLVEDLGSANGTFINGQRLRAATPLRPGDTLQLGTNVTLGFGPPGAGSPVLDLAPTRIENGPAPAPARSPYSLTVQAGPQPGQVISLAYGAQTLGRAPDCSIQLTDPTLSKQHARLTVQPGGVVIQDLGSSNGTFVNGQPVVSPVEVRPGDMIQVGPAVILRVQGPGVAAAAIPVATIPALPARRGMQPAMLAGIVGVVALIGLGLVGVMFWANRSTPAQAEATATATGTATPTATLTPVPAMAMTFSADRDSVKLGECATLRWQVQNAKEVRLDGESVPADSSRKVCPQEAAKTYRLTALSLAGETREQAVSLVVPPTPAPPPGVDIEFSADSTTVTYGSCATLRWQVTNAQAVRLEGEKVGASGSQQVCPQEPATTYRLLVQPLQGELVEQTVIINIPSTPMPTASPTATPKPQPQSAGINKFIADQYTLNPGGCTTLRWEVWNAQSVRLDGNSVANQGDMRVCPTASTNTYTLSATGPGGGSVQTTLTLNVNAPTATPMVIYVQPPMIQPPVYVPPSGPPIIRACVEVLGGACYIYRWDIDNVKEIYFDGHGVTGHSQTGKLCGSDYNQGIKGNLVVIHRDGRSEEVNFYPPTSNRCN